MPVPVNRFTASDALSFKAHKDFLTEIFSRKREPSAQGVRDPIVRGSGVQGGQPIISIAIFEGQGHFKFVVLSFLSQWRPDFVLLWIDHPVETSSSF